MNNSPTLLIQKLEILGTNKNYLVEFKEGINIIWGDLDCGKSSILSIIAYCLGATKLDSYQELEDKARSARLFFSINDDNYIFERSLFRTDAYIKGYKNTFNDSGPSIILSPELDGDAPDGYVSFYIMNLMGLPITKIKVSPSKTDSQMNRVGFKDVLKFIYLKQKEIASDTMLNMNDKYRYVKNKEVLKFLLNIHNEKISELESELAFHQKELNSKSNERKDIEKFLSKIDFNFSEDLEGFQKNQEELSNVEAAIHEVKSEYIRASGTSDLIKERLKSLNEFINNNYLDIENLNSDLSSFIKLRNSYTEEKESITTSLNIHSQFHKLDDKTVFCPLCKIAQPQNHLSELSSLENLSHEKKTLNKKILSLNVYIDSIRDKLEYKIKKSDEARNEIDEIQYNFNQNYAQEVSELIETISLLERTKVDLISNKKLLGRDIKIKNRLELLQSEESNLEKALRRVSLDLINAKDEHTPREDIINRLSRIFGALMKNSLLKNVEDSRIDLNLNFKVRGKILTEHSSGGVRTITSLVTYLSNLVYSILYSSNIPSFMMIDTPGNNIGRYRAVNVHGDEVSSDQHIYERVYEQLLKIDAFASKKQRQYQLIIVDNDLAKVAERNPNIFNIAKRFSKSDKDYDCGLINDYKE